MVVTEQDEEIAGLSIQDGYKAETAEWLAILMLKVWLFS
jgi:hypothetical protein